MSATRFAARLALGALIARNDRRHVAQTGATRAEAEAKALRRCGAGCEPVAWVCTR